MSEARVRVSLTDGVLEFEGSESFVAGQIEKFTGVIHTALAGERSAENDVAAGDGGSSERGDSRSPAATAALYRDVGLTDIFAATDTGVQILRALPGSSKAAKAVNGAKLYLYGLQALKQRDTAFFAEIARICKTHGCYDSHNMAAYLKGDQKSFVFGGQGKRQTVKLSAPGMEGTEALIARIRAQGNGTAFGRKRNT